MGCLAATRCRGSLSMRVGRTRVGTRRFAVGAGDGTIVHLRLSPPARRTLAHNGRLIVRLTVNGPNGGRQSSTLLLIRFR